MLSKFEKFVHRFSGWFEWVGMAGLLTMMLITCVDVFGVKTFLLPIPGAIDIVMVSQLVAIAFAAAITLILGRHVRVEFFVARLPRRAQAVIDSFVLLLGLGLFVMIIWQLSLLGHYFQTGGETSMSELRIPLFPFPYAIALASIPVCLVFLLAFFSSLARVVKG